MKRFLALVLALIFTFALAACGAGGQAPASSSSEPSSAPANESDPLQSGGEAEGQGYPSPDTDIYRYDDLPDLPLPDIVPQKINYHNVLVGDEFILRDAGLIEQTMELLGRVKLYGPPFWAEDAEPDRVVSLYRYPEDEEPSYSLCFLEDGSMYIETADGRSEAYASLNWAGSPGEEDGLGTRLGKRIKVWVSPDLPDRQLPEGTLYTVKGSPYFQPAFDEVKKIYNYDAALGEEWTVTDPQVIEKIVEKIKYFTFYDQPAPDDPWTGGFTYQCFDYFAFYANEEDETPIFAIGLNPFYVKIGEEKFGPYADDILDEEITELLKLFLPAG